MNIRQKKLLINRPEQRYTQYLTIPKEPIVDHEIRFWMHAISIRCHGYIEAQVNRFVDRPFSELSYVTDITE